MPLIKKLQYNPNICTWRAINWHKLGYKTVVRPWITCVYIGICIIKKIDKIMQLKNIFCILQFKEPVNLKHNKNYSYICKSSYRASITNYRYTCKMFWSSLVLKITAINSGTKDSCSHFFSRKWIIVLSQVSAFFTDMGKVICMY